MGKSDDDLDEFWAEVSGSDDLDKAILNRIVNIVYSICDNNLRKTTKYLKGAAELVLEEEKLDEMLDNWVL